MGQNFAINAVLSFIMKHKLVCIVGPTAIGKTAISIKIAQYFNCEIISADSRQFYKEMSIGTAVPNKAELQAARHHFIQHKSIKDLYSVGDFERDAIAKITELHKLNPYVILVGGSGLYVKAVTEGLDDFPAVSNEIRNKLNHKLVSEGLEPLQEELRNVDYKAYNAIAIDNPHRVIRALEIYRGTGKTYSSFLSNSKKNRAFETIFIGLKADRNLVYDRINHRVDLMMESGLLDEVKQLLPFKDLNALNTVGYKELFKYLEGEISLVEAVSEIKKNTRRFAKRQLTWFKKVEGICWFDYDTNFKSISDYIKSRE